MVIEFDAAKDAANIRKHGIGLARFADMTGRFVAADLAHSQREPRWNVIGVIDQRVYAAVVTYRGVTIRVISLRAASRKERQHYGEATKQS